MPWLVAAVYLPTYAGVSRFFWIAYPTLFLSAAAMAIPWSAAASDVRRRLSVAFLCMITAAFIFRMLPEVRTAFAGPSDSAVEAARAAAPRLRALGLSGPVAGAGELDGGLAGLYLAFFLNQPFLGDYPKPEPDVWFHSGGALIVAPSNGVLTRVLSRDVRFRNLNPLLFGPRAAAFPIDVFQVGGDSHGARS